MTRSDLDAVSSTWMRDEVEKLTIGEKAERGGQIGDPGFGRGLALLISRFPSVTMCLGMTLHRSSLSVIGALLNLLEKILMSGLDRAFSSQSGGQVESARTSHTG